MADQHAGQLQQPEVEVGAALPPSVEPLVGVQPGEAAFDDPPVPPQPGTMRSAASGNARGDAPGSQLPPVLVVVVASVSEQLPGLAPGPTAEAADRWNRVNQWQQLGDVVPVAARDSHLQRDAIRVDDQMVFGAGTAAIDRAGTDVVPL